MAISCPLCQKKCNSKREYRSHFKLEHFFEGDDIAGKIPTRKIMWAIIQDQQKKIDVLESNVKKFGRWVAQKKKQVNIIEYLTNNYHLETTYCEWISSINVELEDLYIVFRTDFVNAVYQVIIRYLSIKSDGPIKCFAHKNNTFYIQTSQKWEEATRNDFLKLWAHVEAKLLLLFKEWEIQNANSGSNTKHELWATNNRKITGHPYKDLFTQKKALRRKLFNYLKSYPKNIMEIEFTTS